MKKKRGILWFAIIFVGFLFFLEIRGGLFANITLANNALKESLAAAIDAVDAAIDRHFGQASEIERLRKIEQENAQNLLTIAAQKDIINDLSALLSLNQKPRAPASVLVKAYSYANLGQYSKIWLSCESCEDAAWQNLQKRGENAVFGLVRNGFAAGIAFYEGKTSPNNGLLGVLNNDPKVAYGVYIGESKSLGVLKNIGGAAVVEYINAWSEVKEGDEVFTNGLDGVFFEGLKVGRVRAVRQEYGYIIAEVELYGRDDDLGYFWLVDMGEAVSFGAAGNAGAAGAADSSAAAGAGE